MDFARKVDHVCRICAVDQHISISVFSQEGQQLFLQAKIRKYLHIAVQADDKLPKMICIECCMRLDGVHRFATLALKSQELFNKDRLLQDDKDDAPGGGDLAGNKLDIGNSEMHSYLSKVKRENEPAACNSEASVTEMEVRLDPMLFLQCSLEDNSNSAARSQQTQISPVTEHDYGAQDFENSILRENQTLLFNSLILQHIKDENDTSNSSIGSDGTIQKKILSKKQKKMFICNICPKTFQSDIALQSHMWGHLPKSRSILTNSHTNSVPRISDQDMLDYHDDSDNPLNLVAGNLLQLSCPICGKQISTKGNLKVHLETHRPKGKYACDICGRIFKTQSNLYRHKEYHGGVQFSCEVCGRVYPTNSTLRAHSITHSDARPHACPLCHKTFKRNQDLKFHINQHTGARPYQCPYCPKAFASSGNCFSHRKRMHPREVERDRERAAQIMR